MNIETYLENPCKAAALPYWKETSFIKPEHLLVIHQNEFKDTYLKTHTDYTYFKLVHHLTELPTTTKSHPNFKVRPVKFRDELEQVVSLINQSYATMSVNLDNVQSWLNERTCDLDLWVWVINRKTNTPIGLGIAHFDDEIKEGSLEWIQVLPQYRNQGIGTIIVTELLNRLKSKATFVTVSGEVNNITKPEMLYRRCGFTGNDVWHVLNPK